MKLYIHKIWIVLFLLFGIILCDNNLGIATIYACDLEDDDDWWQFEHDGDDWWTFLPEVDCTPDTDNNLGWDTDDDDWDDDDWDDVRPCEMGDCDDWYEDDSPNKNENENEQEIEEDDCDPDTGRKNAVRRAKGKDDCVEDCAGVWGGKAYTKECNGETICIDGNNGTFTNTLTGEALEKFEQVEQEMLQNCLQAALLNNLNEYYGIQIGYSEAQQYPGSFNPCNYSIVFNSVAGISSHSVAAELFHAYQEQYLGKLLSNIQNSADHKGGSNIEAEEKAFGLLCNNFTLGIGVDDCYVLLVKWCLNFYNKYEGQHSNVTLTAEEAKNWFDAVEEFRECNQGKYPGTLYDSPVDKTIFPSALLNLWNLAEDCSDGFVVRPIIGTTNKPLNKWKRIQ